MIGFFSNSIPLKFNTFHLLKKRKRLHYPIYIHTHHSIKPKKNKKIKNKKNTLVKTIKVH